MSDKSPVIERVIEMIRSTPDLKGDEAQVCLALAVLWERHGLDYDPMVAELVSLCRRSDRFIRKALSKLRDKRFVCSEKRKFVAGDAYKSSSKEGKDRHHMPDQPAPYAGNRHNVPAQYAGPDSPYIESSPEGRFLSNFTTSSKTGHSQRARAEDGLPPGFDHLGHGAIINCETVKHKDFTISITGIEMELALKISTEEAKTKAKHIASYWGLCWAAEIEDGNRPEQVLPASIPAWMRRQGIRDCADMQIHDVKLENARKSGKAGGLSGSAIPGL